MSDQTAALPQCTHYDLSLSIQPEPMHPAFKLYGGTIQVDCMASIQNDTSEPMEKVPLLLYRLLQVQAVCDAAGTALPFSQTVVAFSELPRKQVNAIEVCLPKPVPSGETTQLCLRYAGPVCGYTEVWPYQHDHVSEAYTLLLRKEIGEDAYWKRLNDYRSYFVSSKEAAAIPLAEAGQHTKVRETLSRGKGPWLMCVLHHLLDERMLPVLRTFFDRYREQGATLEDFEATIIEAAGPGLSAFFQEWLWGTRSSAYLAKEIPGPELARQLVAQYALHRGRD